MVMFQLPAPSSILVLHLFNGITVKLIQSQIEAKQKKDEVHEDV